MSDAPKTHPHIDPARPRHPTPNHPTRRPQHGTKHAQDRQNNPTLNLQTRHLALPPSSRRRLPAKPLLPSLGSKSPLPLGRARSPRSPNSHPQTGSKDSNQPLKPPSNSPHPPPPRSIHLLAPKLQPHPGQRKARQSRHPPRPGCRPPTQPPILPTRASAYLLPAPLPPPKRAVHLRWEVRHVYPRYARRQASQHWRWTGW